MKLQEVAGLYVRLFSGGYVAMVDDNFVGMSMQKFEKMMVAKRVAARADGPPERRRVL